MFSIITTSKKRADSIFPNIQVDQQNHRGKPVSEKKTLFVNPKTLIMRTHDHDRFFVVSASQANETSIKVDAYGS